MRKPVYVLATAIAGIVLASLTSVGYASGTRAPAKPRLVLLSSTPLRVQGRHFKPHSQVTLTLTSSSKEVKRAAVNGSGRFTATFATGVDRCTLWTVTARQNGRTRAVLRSGPRPLCPVPPTP